MPDDDDDFGASLEGMFAEQTPVPVETESVEEAAASLAPPPPVVTMAVEDEEDVNATFSMSTPVVVVPPAAPVDEDEEGANVQQNFQCEREVPDIQKPWMKHHKFTRVETIEQLRKIVDVALKHGRCALDTETEGLDTRIVYDALGKMRTVHQIVGYCLSVDGVEGFYAPVRHNVEDGGKNLNLPIAEAEAEITRLCHASQPLPGPGALDKDPLSFREADWAQKPQVILYFWNAKFDQEMLMPVTGIDWWHPESFEDGMLACFCHFSADKSLSLKDKAPEALRDIEGNAHSMIALKELFIRGRPIKFNTLSPDEPGVLKYACSDAINTYLLCEPPRKHEKERIHYIKLAHSDYAFTYRLEKQDIQAVRGMERNRVRVNKAGAKELLDAHKSEYNRLLGEIQTFGQAKGFSNLDPNSPKQLSDFLFTDKPNCLNLSPKPEKHEASGQYITDGETLEAMVADNPHAPPILKWIVEFRGEGKNVGTYLEPLFNHPDHNSELRFGFKETGAGTGRFSAPGGKPDHGYSGLPIHGIPGASTMRKLFEAREGYTFVKCDFAGQELRIAANVSGEPVWVKEFLEGSGDLHTITAKAFFNKDVVSKEERGMGKTANFALIYGGGPQAIIRATGCDKVEASRRKQSFDKSVPVFAGWIKNQQRAVKKDRGVWTAFKRWLAIPDANVEDRKVQAACERYAVNYPIQGSGADIMKISMVTLHKEFYKRGWLKTNGGDDSVRMLLTVHDEVVFEIKNGRVTEAVPVIVDIMERPGKLATPRWKIPLVVEPLVGPNWGTGYKCERAKKDSKIHEGEVLVKHELGDFIYGTIREVDLGKDQPGILETEHKRDGKKVKIRILDPVWLQGIAPTVPTDDAGGSAAPAVETAPATPRSPAPPPVGIQGSPAPAPIPAKPTAKAPAGRVVKIRINRLTEETVLQVLEACSRTLESGSNGSTLKLMDLVGTTLIDPSLRIRVNASKLAEMLDKRFNISNGRFEFED